MQKKNRKRAARSFISLLMAFVMVISTMGFSTLAAEPKEASDLKATYRIYHIEDATQRFAPGADVASEGNNLWLWEQGANASADCEMFWFEEAGDGTYYWYCRQADDLVMQAESAAVSMQRKSDSNAAQKWTVEKVEGTEDQYYLKNGERYVSTSTNYHTQVSMSDTPQAWSLKKVEASMELTLSDKVARTGDNVTASVTGFDENGVALDGSGAVFTSSDPEVAAVEGNVIAAKKAGTAVITADLDGTEVAEELTVLDASEEWPGVYRIDNVKFEGYLLEPGGDWIGEGSSLYLWNTALAPTRMWVFTEAGDGYVYWHPRSNMELVIQGGDLNAYTSMQKMSGADEQKWKIIKDEASGNYRIQNKASGKYIGTENDANWQLVQMKEENAETALWIMNELEATISLELSASYVQTGKTVQVNAVAKDAAGEAITNGIRLESTDESVAKIEGSTLTGLKEGYSDITAYLTVSGKEYVSNTIRINVTDEAPVFTGREWYKDIAVAEVNREPSHADFIPYQDAKTAFDSEKSALDDVGEEKSAYYQLLTQKEWDFALVENPEKADAADAKGYLEETLPEDVKGDFAKEFVPHAWQTYRNEDQTFKYFDEGIYTNSIYPWGSVRGNYIDYDDPQAPVYYNPVGYYRTEFETPADWDGREIFISLQSVRSAYYLFVNGRQVGYTADSFTAHDFNITPYLNKNGEKNTIALKVYRWCIGSYLENQDFIQLSGIMRDIFLYSKDKNAEIRDFFVQTSFADRTDKNSDVTMNVDVDVRNLTEETNADGYTVDVKLLDMDGTLVGQDTVSYDELTALKGESGAANPDAEDADGEKKLNLGDRKTATIQVENPKKWFPDTPNLYMVTLELKDHTGKVVEAVAEHVGFREIYKVNINDDEQEQMQITGQKIIFRGVNRHDTSLENGSAVTNQEIIDDLKLMKQFNVNAVRTSHYPNAKLLYDVADELGIYVYAEANVESHYGAYGDHAVPIPGADSRWVTPVVDRNMNMLELLKNHASIIGWSYGNEATYTRCPLDNTYCFWAAAMAVLNRDPSRLRMYERESDGYYHRYQKDAGADPWGMETRSKNIVDVHSTQYPEARNVESYAKNANYKLPYFEQEYEHAMGQSFGSFNEFWKLNRTLSNVQGGFIWDWADQSLETTREDGTSFWGYGGDWIDGSSNADAFCANGVLFADHTPSAKAVQMRYDHQQVNFYLADENAKVTDGKIEVKVVNELENSTLEGYDIVWTLTKDDKEIKSGTLNLSTPCMSGETFGEEMVSIELPKVTPKAGDTYMLEFSVQHKEKPDWDAVLTKYDNVLAHEQFDLTPEDKTKAVLNYNDMKVFTRAEDGDVLTVEGITDEGKAYSLKMDKTSGILYDYTVDGKVVLEKGPVPSFWRAQTYNDTPVAYDRNMRNADDNMELVEAPVITKDENGKHIRVELNVKLPIDADQSLIYDIYGNGEIVVSSSFTPRSNFAPGTAGNYALPKVGVRMTLSSGYENLEYFGRGPEENYIDRKTSADVGVYKSTVTDQFVSKYVKPQENGNHTDVRWTALTDEDGNGIMVAADGTVESSALHVKAENINPVSWTDYQYNSQTIRHSTEVPMDEEVYLCVDAIQRGVSNTGFFNHVPLEGFYPTTRPNADGTYNTYAETFRIVPVTAATDKMEESKLGFTAEEISISEEGLAKLVAMTETLDASEYTADSWAALETAVKEAKALLADKNAAQAEFDAAVSKLTAALGNLEYGVQKLHLETAIKAAEPILALGENYEDTKALAAAVESGREVLANTGASQEEVDNAAYAVLDELFKMAKKADIESLESLIEAAKDLLDGNYTKETTDNLKDAIAKAEAVAEDQNRGEDDIRDAYANLIDAIINLEMKGNKAALKAMLAKANEVLADADAYVASTIAGLSEVTAEAQAVYDDDDAVQSEVNEAVKTLTLKLADARLLGDVDGDGAVTTSDSASLLAASAELTTLSEEAEASADVNGDGAADTSDAALILQYAAEKITAF